MSRPHLVACPSCSRHIRVDEVACPFCHAETPQAVRDAAPPVLPSVRLSRAALYAVGVGSISLSAACGGDVAKTGAGGGTDAGRDGLALDSSSVDTGHSQPPPPPYGAPPPPRDSGMGTDTALQLDATSKPDATTQPDATEVPDVSPPPPPYGLPPPPPRDS